MISLARTIESNHTTGPVQVHNVLEELTAKELSIKFGRDKRTTMDHLPSWAKAVHMRRSERDLLGEIIRRSRQSAPWTWEDRYGVASMAAYLGMNDRTFKRAVKNLVASGDLTLVKFRRGWTIYRVPDTTINAIRGRGNVNVTLSGTTLNRTPCPIQPRVVFSVGLRKSLQTKVCLDVRQERYISSSNNNSSSRGIERKDLLLKKSAMAAQAHTSAGRNSMRDDDEGPVLGADPDRVRSGAAGSKGEQFARYFEAAWARVEPERRERELGWPQRPWGGGGPSVKAFRGWVAKTLLPAYQNNLPFLEAMVDEFCANHVLYFSPYQQWQVWKQFNRSLAKIRTKVLSTRPEFNPNLAPAEPDEATMERYRERQRRAEAKLKGLTA